MNSYVLLLIGVLLVSIVFALAYKIFALVNISKRVKSGEEHEDSVEIGASFANKINAFLFPVFFVGSIVLLIYYNDYLTRHFLPVAASEHGPWLDFLFWLSMWVIIVAFLLTAALLFVFPFLYQYKSTRTAKFYPHNDRLEIIWTVIPAIIMGMLVITGWRAWADITSPPSEDALEIEIMGKQFNWQVRYPGMDKKLGAYDFRQIDADNSFGIDFINDHSSAKDDFVPGKLVLPKGQEVFLRIRARDVLHSVFLPHFRVKMDAVPGNETHFKFTPTITTDSMRIILRDNPAWQIKDEDGKPLYESFNYELACTEICGGSHFAMKLAVEVLEPEDFKEWYDSQQPWLEKNDDYKRKLEVGVASKESSDAVSLK